MDIGHEMKEGNLRTGPPSIVIGNTFPTILSWQSLTWVPPCQSLGVIVEFIVVVIGMQQGWWVSFHVVVIDWGIMGSGLMWYGRCRGCRYGVVVAWVINVV